MPPFGTDWFAFGITRCDPNVIVGTEIVRALPRPSSRETLNGSSEFDASIGKIAECRCASNDGGRSLAAVNRRGKPIQVRVSAAPMLGPEHQVHGVILTMEEQRAQALAAHPPGGGAA